MTARLSAALLAATLAAACSSLDRSLPSATSSVIPDTKLRLTPGYTTTPEKLIYFAGAAYLAYVVLDPMAPHWTTSPGDSATRCRRRPGPRRRAAPSVRPSPSARSA